MSKYKAIKTVVDGITFASKKEAKRYLELKLLERAGEIGGLERQVKWDLAVNGIKICSYVCDFYYFVRYREEGISRHITVVEDVKSTITAKLPVYKIKKKLMLACHAIEIQEIF